jgi:signal transduction histidine kinase
MTKETYTAATQGLSEEFLDTLPQVFCRFYAVAQTLRFDYISHAVFDWTGCTPETFVLEGLNWLERIHPSDRRLLLEALDKAEGHPEGFVVEYRIIDAADSVRYVRHRGRCAAAEEGQVPTWNGCMEDITSIHQAQQDLERSQLLQNMGRLVAGIAHEINTPIQFIGDNLHFLAEAWEAMCLQLRTLKSAASDKDNQTERANAGQRDMDFLLSEAPDAIRQSLEGIERVSDLVSAMRDFSRLDERRMAAADLNRAVHSTLTLLRNELKYTADIRMELDPALSEVYCSIDEISRVLMNLLVNAGHSIKEKIDKGLFSRGLICVRTRRIDKQVEIAIIDNGMGIPEAIRQRIFERFFTTKRNSQAHGTGQGLAMARSIVEERHHGQIEFESAVEQGTTFYLRIPLGRQSEGTGR